MSRDQSYLLMLEASALMQQSISRILTAKMEEAKINQVWISSQLLPSQYEDASGLHKQSMELHDQLIEVIDGIAKMEFGLARNLKIILNRDEPQQSYGDMFGGVDS
ncbi:MAG: hypothetical protein K6T85_18135 [Gorillibacterium sp.]|nr:hypothetical protein [Gorillibacterium sp.]